MKRALLLLFVVVPVLIGMRAAAGRGPRRSLGRLLAALAVADVVYALFLYYLFFRLG